MAKDAAALLIEGAQYGDEQTRRTMEAELRQRLAKARPLRVYLGVDATAPELHLGHTVPMRKLAQFQEMGHECALLIGDFTTLIGDPTDRDKTRPQLGREQIEENVKTFARQAFKILDPDRTVIRYNSKWLSRLTFQDVIMLASVFTVAQFLERENFGTRYQAGTPIHLHEFFYPLMQGYDAVAQRADVQLGGSDQTFNIMAGRKVQQAYGQPPQVVITMPLLPGTDGVQKMSKSLGNAIAIESGPEDLYGKLMSLPDSAMLQYFTLLTTVPSSEVDRLLHEGHPRDVKMRLAREITSTFHGPTVAERAESHFVGVFQQHTLPAEMPEHTLSGPVRLVALLTDLRLAGSNNEARRVIQQGGVRLDGERITDVEAVVEPNGQARVLQVGKRHFVRLVP